MAQVRTFVAVQVTPEVRRRAAELIDALRASQADVRWVDPENVHLTLQFLGDVADRRVPEVCRRVTEAASHVPPFRLALGGAGVFPVPARPRTIWLGVQQGGPEIGALKERIEQELQPMGFRREARRYVAHLTLGRVRAGSRGVGQLATLVEDQASFDAGSMVVRKVVVLASYLDRSGPTYQVLGRAPLGDDL